MITKSIFVKVPLKDEPTFASVNVRELVMFTDVLPKLSTYLDEKCDGFFSLPMPERIHCYYDGKGVNDVFIFENLLADGFVVHFLIIFHLATFSSTNFSS